MNETKHGPRFWIGNGLLMAALIEFFYLERLSEAMGIWAVVLWVALAGAGAFFISTDKGGPTGMTD